MQRVFATLLLGLVSYWLALPFVVAANPDAQVPACCRRFGRHHCMLSGVNHSHENKSGISIVYSARSCPFFAGAGLPSWHPSPLLLAHRGVFFGNVLSHPAGQAQTEARYRISFQRSCQKRGPPRQA